MRALETGRLDPDDDAPARGVVVLPGLPGVRTGLSGGGAVRANCSRSGGTTSGGAVRRPPLAQALMLAVSRR